MSDGGNWCRNTLTSLAVQRWKLDLKGGTVGDLRKFTFADTFTADYGNRDRASNITFTDGLKYWVSLLPYKNTSDSKRYVFLSTLEEGASSSKFSPFWLTLDAGAWVIRVRPKAGTAKQTSQSGAYTCPNLFWYASQTPNSDFQSGNPDIAGTIAEVHWRESPLASNYYKLKNGATITTHNMEIRLYFALSVTWSTNAETGTTAHEEFDPTVLPTWPPA